MGPNYNCITAIEDSVLSAPLSAVQVPFCLDELHCSIKKNPESFHSFLGRTGVFPPASGRLSTSTVSHTSATETGSSALWFTSGSNEFGNTSLSADMSTSTGTVGRSSPSAASAGSPPGWLGDPDRSFQGA